MNIKGDDVAVIGLAGKFPGADNVAEFWDNLCAGRDSVRSLTDEELRCAGVAEADLNSSSYVKAAALLDDVDKFDAAFFKIAPLEAELMDPQIRLLLQCAWQALEDAGHAAREARNIGVFAGAGGVTTSYFSNFVNRNAQFEKITASPTHLANDKDFLATYLSYKLNLTGPSVTVQTACSTSLVALHQARLSLLSGECDMALAGGVTVRVPHGHGYHYKEGYIFSKSGRVRTFDAAADGVVFGSGLGLVLIKRLDDASRDGDNIYAVIKGSAIANDGRGKMSYAASSAKGQIACIRSALKNAGVHAGSIGFVETHGTGTAMGDPEEVKALTAVFKEQTDRKNFCGLGAVKTNVGHLEAAAGIVGFIKAVLAVKHGLIPPTVHYSKPNSRIKFESSPFYVNGALQPWDEAARPRRAAVNSLGVGGTNAFVILEEFIATPRSRSERVPAPVIVPLSAKSQSSLRAYARKLADYIATDTTIDVGDLAYTLQVGREAMACRVAFVVSSLDELKASLNRYLESGEAGTEQGESADLARAWVSHGEIDWGKLYPAEKPRRIRLPTYVFAKDRYWIERSELSAAPRGAIHPLLHVNTSDLSEHRYTSTFTGEEFFLRDHLVRTSESDEHPTQKVLPGVAYLEMARAAIERATPHSATNVLELRDVVWVQPIVVSMEQQVGIALVANEQRVHFEVYSGDQAIHCQGHGRFLTELPPAKLDLARLKAAMGQGDWTAPQVYPALAKMGLGYGPAHQAITHIYVGERQLLAELRLPSSIMSGQGDFVLHPSLLDGALQATLAVQFDLRDVPDQPVVPFAVESLRVISACTPEMYAWVRHSHGQSRGGFSPIDVDLCDQDGNICVQIRGFVARALGKETTGSVIATEVWRPSAIDAHPIAHGERHVVLCDLPEIDASQLGTHASRLQTSAQHNLAARYGEVALACFDKLRALIQSKPQGRIHVQFVLPNSEEHSMCAGLSGMFKTATLENPQITGQIILTRKDIETSELVARLLIEHGQAHDTVVRYDAHVREVRGWQVLPTALNDPAHEWLEHGGAFKDHGVYLITGGLGGLGVLFAREILKRSPQAKILLTGRASPAKIKQSPAKRASLDSLQADGASVEYRQLNLEDLGQVTQAIASIQQQYGQLNGIIHSAGMTADSFILKKTVDELRSVLAPKVLGTVNLDQATRDVDLDFLILFSSLTSAVGNLGQADYAAANGFMDHFASYRNRRVDMGERRGLTLAIRWPWWRDGGMQVDQAGRDMLQASAGIRPLQTSMGLHAFYRSLASGCDQTLVMAGDLQKIRQTLQAASAEPAARTTVDAPAEASAGDLTAATQEYLRKQLSALLKLPAYQVDVRAPLEDYGINSILALEFTRSLEQAFGPLPKTLFFEYLTIQDLAAYFVKSHAARLAALFSGAALPAPKAPAQAGADSIASIRTGRQQKIGPAVPRAAATVAEPIAIVGLSGRYPEARDLEALWCNLRDGRDCIVEVPKDRWDWRDYYSEDRTGKGCHFSKWGGFIAGVDEFDARFFNISPLEAQTIDPQERLFLQHAWMAIEDAGYTRAGLQVDSGNALPGQVGVYAGVMYGEYQLFGAEASMHGNRMGFASNVASIANRVSYVLNLHGPSMAVDTMCSSSLTAIHLACQDLMLGRTAAAIAGGVNVTIHPNKYLMLSAGQFISGDGHCQSFGEGGDGYIPGEGVGVVVLKRLSDAQRDGNHIYGVIRGSALSHGGKTNGYTVPNPGAQASAIRQALAEASINPRHISYVEAHGTGTKLGDPIEIAALSKVFQESTSDTGFCLIGSAKSNIGHCEAAAGIAGLTKVLLQLKHQRIVPSLHSSRLNPHIDFRSSPFVVNQTLRPWQQPVIDGKALPRIAGISSFGAGGSNAHLIVEEYPAPVEQSPTGGEFIVPLSARTAEQLQQKARDLLEFVRASSATLHLPSMAYTLQVGREAMEERAGFLVNSIDQLAQKLHAYVDGRVNVDGVYQGQVKPNKETLSLLTQDPDLYATIDKWIADGKRSKLLDLWVRGLELDWPKFHATKPALISLPTYPFARQRYWVDAVKSSPRVKAAAAADVLHPLLHANTSDFGQQSYTATFGGDEFFLVGAPGERCLHEGAYLEMARVAIEKSMPARRESSILELRNLAWAQPGVPVEKQPVIIALFDNTDDQVRFEVYSRGGEQEQVHCQGEAIYSDRPAPSRLDLAAIRQDGQSQLVELPLPAELADERGDYILHPAWMASAMQAAASLSPGAARPVAIASIRIICAAAKSLSAWFRPESGSRAIDMDLCDGQGNVYVQMRGIQYRQPEIAVDTTDAAPKSVPLAAPKPVALQLTTLRKPSKVALVALNASAQPDATSPVAGKAKVVLASTSDLPGQRGSDVTAVNQQVTTEVTVRVFDHGEGVFAIQIAEPMLSASLIEQLLQAMHTVQQAPAAKVLTINGVQDCFLAGGRDEHATALELKLYQSIAGFPYPVIAAVSGDATGAGFLLAAVCDFMICSEESSYSFTDLKSGLYPIAAQRVFEERFGHAHAADFLYVSPTATGRELKLKGWTCPIVPRGQVEPQARSLATNLARKPQQALRLLKQHLARHILAATGRLSIEPPFSQDFSTVSGASDDLSSELRCIELKAHSPHVLVMRVRAADEAFSAEVLCADLDRLVARIGSASQYRCIVLTSDHPAFLPDINVGSRDAALSLKKSLLALPCPVIAAFNASPGSLGWLVGQFCDTCIYSEAGRYSSHGLLSDAQLAGEAYGAFALRLGNEVARQIVLSVADYSGAELRRNFGLVRVAKPEQVLADALQMAESLAEFPPPALAAWKQRAASLLQSAAIPIEAAGSDAPTGDSPEPLALNSKVITATLHPEGILVVQMADREAKNMFSDAFSRGMREVFAHVENNPSCKVVLITGYDNYFSAGGTQDMLLAIHAGKARFTDNKVFQLPLTCKVPVIAAMQGHGIGAGWALGMYADFTLFSEESRYLSPYMGYGFTPGAGATLIFPERIGYDLARETLLTAQEYSGGELKQRGLQQFVLRREEIVPAALALARRVARRPRAHLMALKRLWTEPLNQPLQEAYELELAMHALTFVGQSNTLAQIQGSFGADAPSAAAPLPAAAVSASPAASADDLRTIAATLRSLLADELRMQEQEISDDEQFVDLGLDSITGVTWIRRINEQYRTAIEAIKVYSYPTLSQLSRHVAEQARQSGTLQAAPKVVTPAVSLERVASIPLAKPGATSLTSWRKQRKTSVTVAGASNVVQPIAVVGMAGQFPRAKNLEEFWDNIAQGRDCVGEVPGSRWDIDRYYRQGEVTPGKTNSKWLGALEEYDRFDAAFFNISPREAKSMDPQQRLFLQACWHTLEHAGYNPKSLSGSRCGVFVGCSAGDYNQLSKREQLSGQGFTGAAPSILAARISYFLDLHGPSLSIDTACSSSLVAIAHACDSLVTGGSDLALAGGVNVMSGPAMHIMTAQVGMLSPQGRCFTFDQRANGIAAGEGVGVVMLKRLADAQRDGDWIYGVVQGWGVNQDGKTNGITAPNADSQARLQQQVYGRFGIDPAGIQLIEAHGTGTALGDPIEVAGLKDSFARFTHQTDYCALGSVKSNIGHCLAAAGVSGFIKLLLALKHRQLPPTIHFSQLNKHISLQGSPFYINTRLQEWRQVGMEPRRAAINSFGFSGTNAHVVIEEYRGRHEAISRNEPVIVPLSARTVEQLVQQASGLLAFIRSNTTTNLQSIAYTLQVGREAMNERLALIVSSMAELEQALQSYAGGTKPGNAYRDQVSDQDTLLSFSADEDFQRMIGKWISHRALPKLAELWVKGLSLDWNKFQAGARAPQRIGLPTYPFAKERHWIEAEDEAPVLVASDIATDLGAGETPLDWTPSPAVTAVAQPTLALEQIQQQLKSSLAEALFMKPADIDIGKSFTELGMDSIIGVEWVRSINKQYGTEIAATRVYDYPTVKELAAHLGGQLPASQSQAGSVAAPADNRFAPAFDHRFKDLYFSGRQRGLASNGDFFVDYAISPETNVCLREHVVFNEHLLPSDAYIELVYSAYRSHFAPGEVCLRNISIANPLLGRKGANSYLRVVFRQSGADVQFFVRSSTSPRFVDEKLHVQGFIAAAKHSTISPVRRDLVPEKELAGEDIPTNTGLYYAPLQKLLLGESTAEGHIRIRRHDFKFLANPFVLYGGLCTVINYAAHLVSKHHGASDDQFLPHQIANLSLAGSLDGSAYCCHAELKKLERDAVEFRFEIVDQAGRAVVAVDSITLRRVGRKAIQQQVAAARGAAPSAGRPVAAATEKVAIIGMSCRYPLSENVAAFWNNLKQGRNCITEVPADRWRDFPDWYHPDPRHPHTSYSKWGGFLADIDKFDPLFFGIAPAEAEVIDPQQRIFLEECWKSIESAGYAPGALSHQSCGVYVGCSTGDYSRVLANDGRDTVGAAFMGTSNAILAARISYYLNLKGPALAVDTACSSSLVAVHLACESIRSGENQWALAGGINLLATPIGHILTSQVGMPSRDGKCFAFDAAANGIVFSEGCGVLVLKALSQAIRDNDNILGVIQASGINQDGKTNGITAPSGNAQEQLLRQTYGKFDIEPQRVSYVEAHGTATALGDPIEVNALTAVFQKFTPEKQYCALGSVKSNIGHTGFAAGVAGIIKVLLCMKHRKLVPSINYSQPNPHIDFAASPFFVNTQYRDWRSDEARLATVSSFGFSGTNAHVVIEEHLEAADLQLPGPGTKVIVPLSARANEQLQQQARDLLEFIRSDEQPIDLLKLSYTLQAGRDSMEARLGFIVSSVEQLAGKLQDYVDGKTSIEDVYRGQAARGDDTLALFTADDSMRAVIDQWIAHRNLPKLLELWVRGFDLDWARLHEGARPRRISLPTYPFAKERYWIAASATRQARASMDAKRLHPLLHNNTSDLSQQGYSSTFSGEEFFLADHRVNGQKVLPAVAYLEMARAAIGDAVPAEQAALDVELRHVVWAQPIIVSEAKNVTVAVFAETPAQRNSAQIDFEIYSHDGNSGDEVRHCQGHCLLGQAHAPERLDMSSLRATMTRGTVAGEALYRTFADMGLDYGPAFQGITAIHRGESQLLVELSLPQQAAHEAQAFILHPSMMDSALQGSIMLIDDIARISGKPPLPFALESLRITAPCVQQMVAFVRYSDAGRSASATVIKVDIDLCDLEGNVCVRLRGFSSRPTQPVDAFDETHYQSIIAGVLNHQLSADEAAALG